MHSVETLLEYRACAGQQSHLLAYFQGIRQWHQLLYPGGIWSWLTQFQKNTIRSYLHVKHPLAARSLLSYFLVVKCHMSFKISYVSSMLPQTSWALGRSLILIQSHRKHPNQGWPVSGHFCCCSFFFFLQSFCGSKLSHLMGDLLLCLLPLALVSIALLLPQGTFPLEFKSMAKWKLQL